MGEMRNTQKNYFENINVRTDINVYGKILLKRILN
jgi:hypothetical protein